MTEIYRLQAAHTHDSTINQSAAKDSCKILGYADTESIEIFKRLNALDTKLKPFEYMPGPKKPIPMPIVWRWTWEIATETTSQACHAIGLNAFNIVQCDRGLRTVIDEVRIAISDWDLKAI